MEPVEPVEPELLEPFEPIESVQPFESGAVPAALERLGPEGLARLRARYAEVMARIAERPMEDEERERLKLRAERLNPDTWVTADEVSTALEEYEMVFQELRAVVGHHRSRRRGRNR